ncbi:MAG TPA: oligosaccharide flippase family protein [Opitutaceae bacterium]|nr:oligosaccharide flippase family protein [Opitutaceae bacterium]
MRPIAVLLSGTALAQAVPVLLSPILSRLFLPEAFGAFALAVSVVTIAALLAGGAYDQGVNLPPERTEAMALVVAMLLGGAAATVVLAAAGGVEWLIRGRLEPRMWFVPVATLLTVAFNAFSAWATREARFPLLVRARLALGLGGAGATLAAALAGWRETGLLLGNLTGLVLGCGMFALVIGRADRSLLRRVDRATLFAALREHRRCPCYLLPSTLLNTVTNQLPVWFLGRLFGAATLGQYALMNRVLNVPIALTSASVGDVFKQRVAAEYRATGQCRQTFLAFGRGLGLAALAPTLALLVWGPDLFAWVFGAPWREAGQYARIFAVLFAFRFAVSPLSYVVIVARKARLDLGLQFICLLAALAAWGVGAATASPVNALSTFVALYSVVYLIYLGLSYRLASPR